LLVGLKVLAKGKHKNKGMKNAGTVEKLNIER
jgi:hypothetical protein